MTADEEILLAVLVVYTLVLMYSVAPLETVVIALFLLAVLASAFGDGLEP